MNSEMSKVPKCIQEFNIHSKGNVLAKLDYDYNNSTASTVDKRQRKRSIRIYYSE